jgi:hypothetical protein
MLLICKVSHLEDLMDTIMKTQIRGQKSAKTFHSTIVLMFLID